MKLFLSNLLLMTVLIYSTSSHGQNVDPYLQALTSHSIAVNWKTSAAVASPAVIFGTAANMLTQTGNGTSKVLSDVGYPGNYFYHTVKLHALAPATKYYYQVISGNDSSEICSFRTLPVSGLAPNASGKLRFLILGDNQIKSQPRYDSLMVAAKRKMTELYGTDFNDSVSFILNLGDQVDVGTLDHYENVHLKKSRYLSKLLPIYTAVGNHETYGTLQMQAYYDHFLLDSMQYKGIYSGTEDYYAFQAGNVVVAYMNTENTAGNQFNWIKKVIDSVNVDPTVDWIITIAHRPYQAEQYVGDISPWIRNTVVPYCMQSPKFFMHVGAHHHLYARGQMKEVPAYNVISGGTAWDQYWGMASEQNFDDVQKTLSNWAYQLVEVDMIQDKIDVTTYSIGSIYSQKNNVVIDSFHRYKNLVAPATPSITNNFPDSLQLPVTITASTFQSTANELLNSTEFQVALDRNFSVLEKNSFRHYEDLFSNVSGHTPDTTADQNLGVNITQYTLPSGAIPNGWHYVRVRYRDRNQSWSSWSATDSFKVYNSIVINPVLTLDTNRVLTGDTVRVTYSNGSPAASAWIGIYVKGQTPGSSSPSVTWKYTNGANGTLKFTLSSANEYYVAYFDTLYNEIAARVPFYYGSSPVLTTSASNYNLGQTVPITYSNAPGLNKDWIGVYKIGMTPGGPASIKWTYTSGTSGTYNVTGLGKGYYFASYFLKDLYFEAGPRVYFSVGDTITTLSTNKTIYNLGEYIAATWFDGPGNPKDWLGIYHQGANPNVDTFISYTYIDGLPSGSKNIPDSAMPSQAGNYYIVLFTNDSYSEVSNRISFQMANPLDLHLVDFYGTSLGLSHRLHWQVADEGVNEKYTLEHSADGKTFTSIYQRGVDYKLGGQYDYINETPHASENYYRLKLTDENGKISYSGIVKLFADEKDVNTVRVYPNPAKSGNKSVIESPYPIDQIDLLDVKGELIYQTKNVNNNKFSLMHHDLPAGIYFIKIYSRKVYTAKLIIE